MGANKKWENLRVWKYLAIIFPFITLMSGPFGCALQRQVIDPSSPKFSEAEVGTVAAVSPFSEPEFNCPYRPKTKEEAAGIGAAGGFAASIYGGAMGGGPLGLILGIAMSPVVAVGGAIYGAIEGETPDTIRKTEETFNHCLADFRPQRVMQERVLSLAQEKTRCVFVLPDQDGPNVPDEEKSYALLSEKSIDTVLEINVEQFGLSKARKKDAFNPSLSLFMTVSIRLVRVKTGEVLSSRTFSYASKEKHKFAKWATNDGQPIKDELERCFKNLAERVVVELFVT